MYTILIGARGLVKKVMTQRTGHDAARTRKTGRMDILPHHLLSGLIRWNPVCIFFDVFFENHKPFIKKALSSIEARLPKSCFFRANRQYIVNLNAIASINESISDGYDLTMSNGQLIEVSRRNAIELKKLLSF